MCLRSMNVYRTSFTLQRVGNLVHLSTCIDNSDLSTVPKLREDLIFLFVCFCLSCNRPSYLSFRLCY